MHFKWIYAKWKSVYALISLRCCQRIVKKNKNKKTAFVMVWGCISGFLKGPCRSNEQSTLIPAGQERDILLLTTVWLQGDREDWPADVQTCRPHWKRFEHYEAQNIPTETPDSREMNVIYQGGKEWLRTWTVFRSFLAAFWESHTRKAEPSHGCSVYLILSWRSFLEK